MKLIATLLACVAVPCYVVAPMVPTECSGCTGTETQPASSPGSCITITVVGNFDLATGNCKPIGETCQAIPCAFSDDVSITITNGCGGELYLYTKTGTNCDAGHITIPAPGGDATPTHIINYTDGDKVQCGTSKTFMLYALYGPSTPCGSGASIQWSYSCSGCGLTTGS